MVMLNMILNSLLILIYIIYYFITLLLIISIINKPYTTTVFELSPIDHLGAGNLSNLVITAFFQQHDIQIKLIYYGKTG